MNIEISTKLSNINIC